MARKRSTAIAEPGTAVGYIRVSTDAQAESGLGMAAQRSTIEAEAARRGWDLVTIYEDAGVSGKSLNREGLTAALATMREGRAGTLVAAKLDRISRSLPDTARLMEDARSEGWNLVLLDLGLDLHTPAGEFVASVVASAAQMERRLAGQRTREALAAKKAQGVRLGRPTLLGDEVRHRIVAMKTEGVSMHRIAATLTDEGVPTAQGGARWYASTVAAVLRSVALDDA